MSAASTLPAAFAELEPLVADWALATEDERARRRVAVDMATLRAFQSQVIARMPAIIAHLNGFPNDPAALPDEEARLYRLALMAMEASAPIDLDWKTPDIEDVFPIERFRFAN